MDRPEGIGFPGEQTARESADFATGAAGIALFLNRLHQAEVAIAPNFNFVVDELLPGPRIQITYRRLATIRYATTLERLR